MDRIPELAKARQSPQDSPQKENLFAFPPPLASQSLPPSRSSSPLHRVIADYGHSTDAEISSSVANSPTIDVTDGGAAFGHRRRRSSIKNGKMSRGHSRLPSRSFLPVPGQLQIDEESDRHISADEGSELSALSTSDDVELDELPSDDGLEDDEETGLTATERKQRTRRKIRRMQLDQRVAVDHKTSKQEQREADQSVIRNSIINAILIGLWYMFSLSISVYNTWMFSGKHLDFHFPLFTTCMHMLVQFSLASLVLFALPQFRPRADALSNPHNIASSDLQAKPPSDQPLMTRMFYLTRIGPCGAATGLDIGLGNRSLEFISLAFYTMCKSSSLAFVLLFAFLFRLESPSIILILIIAFMTLGVVLMVAGETAFNALGFVLVISAAFFSGFRWALTQILLLRNPATSNPFSSIFYLAPVMFLSLLAIAIPVEKPSALVEGLGHLAAEKGNFATFLIILFPGIIAFLMTSSEFALLQRTSVVTLSICGIFKEVVTITAANVIFGDKLTTINVSGLFITIVSIAAYNYIKIKKMRADARQEGNPDGAEGEALGRYASVTEDGEGETDGLLSASMMSEFPEDANMVSMSSSQNISQSQELDQRVPVNTAEQEEAIAPIGDPPRTSLSKN